MTGLRRWGGTASGDLVRNPPEQGYSGSALAFPFIILGVNSLAAYLLSWIADNLDGAVYKFHLWPSALNLFSPAPWSTAFAPLYVGGLTLLIYWLILFALYKNKIFLRI